MMFFNGVISNKSKEVATDFSINRSVFSKLEEVSLNQKFRVAKKWDQAMLFTASFWIIIGVCVFLDLK